MAIAFDAGSGYAYGAGTSCTVSHTCTGSNLILIAGVALASGSASTCSATYNGVSMTQISEDLDGSVRVFLFYLIAPATGAHDIVFTTSLSVDKFGGGASYSGTKQSGQPDASGSEVTLAGGATYTASATSTVDNCWIVGYLGTNNSFTATAAAGSAIRTTANISLFFDNEGTPTAAGSNSTGLAIVGSAFGTGRAIAIAPYVDAATGFKNLLLMGVG